MDLTLLAPALESEATALIRTDWSNDQAWHRILEAIRTPVDTVASGDPDDFVTPHVEVFDAPGFAGATGETLAAVAGNLPPGYVLLADAASMSEAAAGADITLVYVDLSCPDPEDAETFGTFMGRSFRCSVPEIAAIDENLAIANMDFSDFADYADQHGGVFRGFADGD